jgi:hypothetical protein
VNGSEPKIEVFKPFGEAFELTKKILFQPFNFKKWLIIGFAAFLCGHFSAGGLNFPFANFNPQPRQNFTPPNLEAWKPWLPILIGGFALAIFALIVVFIWLRARGTFIFTDSVVRNRAAIAEPWREYRKEGNSLFFFSLLLGFGVMILFMLSGAIAVPFLMIGQRQGGAISVLAIAILVLFLLCWIVFVIFLNVVGYFMAPVMYIRRCRAVDAFRDVLKLVLSNVGPFVLFCLFGICLVLGMMMIGGIATCLTCCLAALPYVGTVILLPVFVCLRAFGLRFIRQFGPDYDVWAAIPEATTTTSEPPPLPS